MMPGPLLLYRRNYCLAVVALTLLRARDAAGASGEFSSVKTTSTAGEAEAASAAGGESSSRPPPAPSSNDEERQTSNEPTASTAAGSSTAAPSSGSGGGGPESGDSDKAKTERAKADAGGADTSSKDEAAKAGSAKADSAKADSAKADTPKADSEKADSAKADVPKADSAKADSAKADTAKGDSAKTDSAKADSANADSAKADSTKPDVAKVDSAKTDSAGSTTSTTGDANGNPRAGRDGAAGMKPQSTKAFAAAASDSTEKKGAETPPSGKNAKIDKKGPVDVSDHPEAACGKVIAALNCKAAASPKSRRTFVRNAICIRERMISDSLHNRESITINAACRSEVANWFKNAGGSHAHDGGGTESADHVGTNTAAGSPAGAPSILEIFPEISVSCGTACAAHAGNGAAHWQCLVDAFLAGRKGGARASGGARSVTTGRAAAGDAASGHARSLEKAETAAVDESAASSTAAPTPSASMGKEAGAAAETEKSSDSTASGGTEAESAGKIGAANKVEAAPASSTTSASTTLTTATTGTAASEELSDAKPVAGAASKTPAPPAAAHALELSVNKAGQTQTSEISAPSSSLQSVAGGEKTSADITGTDKAKQAPEQLSPQCRAKIYAYHVLKHRNREMCHDIREKCKAALESHCTAGKIRGGGAARTLEDGGAESGSGAVPSMVDTTSTSPAAPTAAFVAWPLEKECLRTVRSKSALVTEECKAALFAEDVVAATTSFRFGGWSGTLDVRSHAIAQPTKTSTDAQEPKTGAEEKASGGGRALATSSTESKSAASSTLAPGSTIAPASASTTSAPSDRPRDSSLDFAPLLKARCESELAAGKCRGWGSELQCLENLATRDSHKELQLKGATAMKTVISYGLGSNVTSSSVGWTSVGGPMKKALPPTSGRTRGLAAGVEVPEKTSVLAANAASSPLYLSQACRKQVQTSVRDRLRDIRLSPELAEKCSADIKSLCPAPGSFSVTNTTRHGKDVASGRVLHCLRRRYYEIQSQDCVDAFRGVLKTMQLDWAADSVTKKACQADRQLLCAHVKNANLVHLCLQEHIDELETDCQKEEFMVSSYAQLDVKTASPYLARMCLLDLDKYCGGTDASDVRALTCLKRQPAHTLHASCEVALRNNELRTSQDYRLKFGVTQSCQKEIQTHCSAEAGLQKPEGKVLLCLVKNLDTIRSGVLGGAAVDGNSPAIGGVSSSGGGSLRAQNQACVSEIQDLANEMGHDVKAAKQVQLACANDIADKCKHVEPGGGRIHDCLVDNLPKLSTECAKKEMQLQSALYSGGANLLPAGLRQCCSRELGLFCASKDHGKSDNKVNCLLQSKSLPETSYRCRECLQRHVKRQNRDFRLSPGLKRECQREIETDCKAALQEQTKNPGKAGGRVIQCLIDNREKLSAAGGNAGCLKAVQLKIRQRADDYRVTPFFHTACETDLATFCKDVKPGNGAVHKCLADHLGQISQSCRALEFRSMAQTSVEDHPLIRTYCRAAYIDATVDRASSSTTPGPPPLKPGSPPRQNRAPCSGGLRGSELFACLERNRDNTEFVSEKCREAIVQVGAKQAKSVLLSPGLTARCGETLNQFVAEGKCPSGTQPITLSKSTDREVDVAAASSSFVAGATPSSKTSAKPTRAALEAGAAGATTPSPPVAASTSAAASAPTSAAAASAASTPTAPAPKAGAPLVPSQPTLATKAVVSGRAVDFMSRIKSWNATGSSASGGGGGGGGKGILCLVDNYKLIQDKACQSVVFRQARMQVRNPFQYRPGFREKCAPVAQKNCKREQGSGFRSMLEEQDSLSWESWVETEVESDGMSHEKFAFDEGGYAGEGDEFGFERGYYVEHEFGFASDYEEFAFGSGAAVESGDFEEPEFSPGPDTTPRDLQAAFLINQVTARKHLHCLADLAPAAFGGPAGGECKEEIRKIGVLSSQDLRLHPQLERRCAHEIKHFCSHLEPGESRVLTCLKAELEIDEARGAALRASKDPKAAKMAAAAQNNNKPATSSTFTQACRISLSRVVLPEVAVETYKSTLGNSRNFPQLVAEKALGKLGLYDEATDQVSFLTLRGPVALLALLSMAFSSFVLCYVVYRKRKTAGYTSYVPDEGRAGGGAGTVVADDGVGGASSGQE